MLLVKSKRTDTMAETILVVDDDSNIREVLHTFFTLKGYEVVLAANGEQALELAKSEMPKAILLDINMPGIDGMETCKRLRAGEKTRLIPIILITAYGATKAEASDAGADDIIYKPFDMRDLSIRLKSVIRVGHIVNQWERLMTYMDELEKNRSELVLDKIEKHRDQLAKSCD
jgi:DNA-binding response OmpR family regulator